jgi:two-component system, NtrC family, sensor kinase
MFSLFVCYIILLFLLRSGLSDFIVANCYGFLGTLSIVGSSFYSGGFTSPSLVWLAANPIVVLLLAGKTSGYFSAVLSTSLVIYFGLLETMGYKFPVEYSPAMKEFFFLSCYSGLVLIIFLVSIVFENVRIYAFNEVTKQKDELQATLSELKSTQSQLIQKEKLASLGELTAGIAHEIQNPLNFVNNYSEVNMELIEELQEEAEKGDTEEIKALLTDLSDNERKIHHHGRRADAIVRGMLEHARATPGEKVPTDLNALADEYLRLAYHGLRAKDSAFQCELVTDFDPNLGKVSVAPSELGRVLLNLFNNAFYAVRQRAMLVADQAYTPTVWVSTHRLDEKVEIEVRDNGIGMPEEVQAKIFQPFFTTKPTGEGTGLGLSLSYDIITKGHGGALRVESKVGEGTEFVVELPVGL